MKNSNGEAFGAAQDGPNRSLDIKNIVCLAKLSQTLESRQPHYALGASIQRRAQGVSGHSTSQGHRSCSCNPQGTNQLSWGQSTVAAGPTGYFQGLSGNKGVTTKIDGKVAEELTEELVDV
eukprot:6068579-Amphidinium_carterae.1